MIDFDRSYNSSIADHIPLLACVYYKQLRSLAVSLFVNVYKIPFSQDGIYGGMILMYLNKSPGLLKETKMLARRSRS